MFYAIVRIILTCDVVMAVLLEFYALIGIIYNISGAHSIYCRSQADKEKISGFYPVMTFIDTSFVQPNRCHKVLFVLYMMSYSITAFYTIYRSQYRTGQRRKTEETVSVVLTTYTMTRPRQSRKDSVGGYPNENISWKWAKIMVLNMVVQRRLHTVKEKQHRNIYH